MVWTMLLVLVTGQVIGVDIASEAECRKNLARIEAGEHMTVTLKNGIALPVAKGIDCVMRRPKVEEGAAS